MLDITFLAAMRGHTNISLELEIVQKSWTFEAKYVQGVCEINRKFPKKVSRYIGESVQLRQMKLFPRIMTGTQPANTSVGEDMAISWNTHSL